jgi:hypothetical protein
MNVTTLQEFRQEIYACFGKGRPLGCQMTGLSTGKAEYSERGPLSLREHGGETYSLQCEHRRFTLTPRASVRVPDDRVVNNP